MTTMQLQDILFSQGFGTRRVCAGLVQQGFVRLGLDVCTLPDAKFAPQGLRFTVQGIEWQYFERELINVVVKLQKIGIAELGFERL